QGGGITGRKANRTAHWRCELAGPSRGAILDAMPVPATGRFTFSSGRRSLPCAGTSRSNTSSGQQFFIGSTVFHFPVVPLVVAEVDLTRTRNLLFVVQDHLFPLGEPTRGARDCEQHWEHVNRELHRLIDYSGIEVYVGIQLAADEVVVFKRDSLELDR